MVAPNLREAVRSQGSGHSKESECECQGCSHEDPRSSLLPAWLWWHETLLQEPFSFLSPAALTLPGPSPHMDPPWPALAMTIGGACSSMMPLNPGLALGRQVGARHVHSGPEACPWESRLCFTCGSCQWPRRG